MDPRTTALMWVGDQSDDLARDGILRDPVEEPNQVDRVLAETRALIEHAGPAAKTIVSTPIVLKPDDRALAGPIGILNAITESGGFKAGTAGAVKCPELVAV